MSLLFSHVTLTSDTASVSLLIGGVPKQYEDLEGWRIFGRFLEDVDEDTEVSVHVKSFLYGDGEAVDATPEEVTYLMSRLTMRPDFLETRCTKVQEYDFSFDRSSFDLFDNPYLEP